MSSAELGVPLPQLPWRILLDRLACGAWGTEDFQMHLSRRSLLAGAGSLAVSAALAPRLATAAGEQKVLRLQTRQIEVGGKPATRYGVHQASGAFGLILDEGDDIDVRLENGLSVPSGLHWHGFDTPWRQDGVPYISGPPIEPGRSADYKFPAVPAGTRWMHSHFGLQEQDLLAAPLIVREKSAIKSGMQEAVIFLEDFSWTNSQTLFDNLRKPKSGGMDMSKPDLNDIDYDAYLANERTLADPDVIDVERNGEVRLRIINAGASTNFTIDLGAVGRLARPWHRFQAKALRRLWSDWTRSSFSARPSHCRRARSTVRSLSISPARWRAISGACRSTAWAACR